MHRWQNASKWWHRWYALTLSAKIGQISVRAVLGPSDLIASHIVETSIRAQFMKFRQLSSHVFRFAQLLVVFHREFICGERFCGNRFLFSFCIFQAISREGLSSFQLFVSSWTYLITSADFFHPTVGRFQPMGRQRRQHLGFSDSVDFDCDYLLIFK